MSKDTICLIPIHIQKSQSTITVFSFSVLLIGGMIWHEIKAQPDSRNIWECKQTTENNNLVADCSNQKKPIYVPQNLPENIKVLNLSGNTVQYISNTSFEIYKELIVLDISNSASYSAIYQSGSFLPLRKLEIMDMSRTCFDSNDNAPNYALPGTIKIFKFENCEEVVRINLSTIQSLEEFHGKGCKFRSFPIFNYSAPVKYVDVRGSDLNFLKIPDIAPFCQLKELKLEVKENTGVRSAKQYCNCTNVEKWLRDVQVENVTLKCAEPKQLPNCTANAEMYENGQKIRDECLAKLGGIFDTLINLVKQYWLQISIALGVSVLLVLLVVIIKALGSRATGQDEEEYEEEYEY